MIPTGDRILLTVWQILAIFPVTFRKSQRGWIEAKFSPVLFTYGILALCILVPTGIIGLVNDLNGLDFGTTLRMKTTTASVVTFCDVLTPMVASIIAVLGGGLNCKRVINIYDSLDKADEQLKAERLDSCHPASFIAIGFIVVIVFSVFDYIVWTNFDDASANYVPFYFCGLITLGTEFQYYNLVVRLNARFRALNKNVANDLAKLIKNQRIHGFIMPMVETISCAPRVKEDDLKFKVGEISNTHWLLCSIIRDLNTAFGVQLLFIFLYIFMHIIINPYFFVLSLFLPNTYGSGHSLLLALQVIWTIIHVIELFVLISPCSSTTDEANKTTSLISKYLNRDINLETRKELQTFIIQLLHHEAEFSACGLFNLNLTRITAVAGAVTTYLVILIQFQNADS